MTCPMFLMVAKVIAPLNISAEERLKLCQCLDLAYAIGAGDMATDPKMPSQTLLIFDERMELIKKLELMEGEC